MRVQRGASRSTFAARVGISYKHMWGIERSKHVASRELLHRIAEALDVAVSAVMESDTPDRRDGAA